MIGFGKFPLTAWKTRVGAACRLPAHLRSLAETKHDRIGLRDTIDRGRDACKTVVLYSHAL